MSLFIAGPSAKTQGGVASIGCRFPKNSWGFIILDKRVVHDPENVGDHSGLELLKWVSRVSSEVFRFRLRMVGQYICFPNY